MTVVSFFTLMGIWALGCLSPGPDVVMVLVHALRGRGVPAALGVVTGISVWIVLSLAGLTWLATSFPTAFELLEAAGGIFLLLYGLRTAWHAYSATRAQKHQQHTVTVSAQPARSEETWRESFIAGLLTNITNPKALAFFTALFASLLPANLSVATAVLIAVSMIAIALAWFLTLALATGTRRIRTTLTAHANTVGIVLGSILALLGVLVLWGSLG